MLWTTISKVHLTPSQLALWHWVSCRDGVVLALGDCYDYLDLIFGVCIGVVEQYQEERNEFIEAEVQEGGVPARRNKTYDDADEQYADDSDNCNYCKKLQSNIYDCDSAAY